MITKNEKNFISQFAVVKEIPIQLLIESNISGEADYQKNLDYCIRQSICELVMHKDFSINRLGRIHVDVIDPHTSKGINLFEDNLEQTKDTRYREMLITEMNDLLFRDCVKINILVK